MTETSEAVDHTSDAARAAALRRTPVGLIMTAIYGTGTLADSTTNTALNLFLFFYLTAVCGLPNSLAPRKRPRTTLSPSFALRDGAPWMVFGTPGGEQQDQWSTHFLLRMVHHRFNIQQSIDLPNFHQEHWPSSFWPRHARPGRVVLEGQFADGVLQDVLKRGHRAEEGPDWSEGRLSGARRDGGQMYAGANPRGMQGYAVGR